MTTQDPYYLSHGSHATPAAGRCAMEWVAYMAGENHTDQPVCVSPVLRRFAITFNDRLGDEDRQKLRPYLARCIGTAGDGKDPERLALLNEFVLRESLPASLDEIGLTAAAQRVRALPLDLTLENVQRVLYEVRQECWDARNAAYSRLRAKVKKRADAVADADAAAAAVAVAVAVAAAAAVADAVAAAVAVAVAAAAAVAVADAASYDETYDAVYKVVKQAADERLKGRRERALRNGLRLFERMLPKELIELPVVEDWQAVCELVR